jgi:chromosome partitioning protein
LTRQQQRAKIPAYRVVNMRLSMGSLGGLQRVTAKSLAPGNKRAVVIAVAAQKGGVGKTTTTVSLGAALARYFDREVLLVDLDAQAHVHLSLREMVNAGGDSLAELLEEPTTREVAEVAVGTKIKGLEVTPGCPELARAENRLSTRIGKELVLRELLQVSRTHYDIILLDCPPNLGNLTINGLVAADCVLIPCNPAMLAVSGVEGLMGAVGEVQAALNPALTVLGLVLTRVDQRNTTTNSMIAQLLAENFGDLLSPVQIGADAALAKAQLAGQDVFSFDPHARAAGQYVELAEWLLARAAAVQGADGGAPEVAEVAGG